MEPGYGVSGFTIDSIAVCLFLVAQRYVVSGLTEAAVKQ
jgi:ABC-type maltose transport system permease subunit